MSVKSSDITEDSLETKGRRREIARDRFISQLKRVRDRLTSDAINQLISSTFDHLEVKKASYEAAHEDYEVRISREQAAAINAELDNDLCEYEEVEAEVNQRTRPDANTASSLQPSQIQANFPQASSGYRSLFSFTPESLPTFDGNPLEFAAFWDRIKAEVHDNPELSSARKFGILASCLKGPPREMIQGLSQTDANYQVVVDLLFDRYKDTRLVVETHVQKIVDLEEVASQNLRSFLDQCESHVRALDALGKSVSSSDAAGLLSANDILVSVLKRKLPNELLRKWEAQQIHQQESSLSKFLEFVRVQVQLEERFQLTKGEVRSETKSYRKAQPKRDRVHEEVAKKTSAFAGSVLKRCPFCAGENHEKIEQCKQVHKLPMHIRFKTASQTGICFMCLVDRHSRENCPAKLPGCGVKDCKYRHHRLLHRESLKADTEQTEIKVETVKGNATSRYRSSGLLQTVQAEMVLADQSKVPVSVLLDPGSDSSFIDADLERRLQLPGNQTRISLDTVGASQKTVKSKRVKFRLSSSRKPFEGEVIEALTLRQVATISEIPDIQIESYSHLRGIDFAPQPDGKGKFVDILIGADFYYDLISGKMRKGRHGEPVAIETVFGWVLGGPDPSNSPSQVRKIRKCHVEYYDEVSEEKLALEKFWEFEKGGIATENLADKDNEASVDEVYRTFKETTEFVNGRYQVRLPWKHETTDMPNNFHVAYECLKKSEKRHKFNEKAMKAYDEAVREYVDLGFAEVVPELIEEAAVEKPGKRIWYLPHHAIVREDRETTKVRIVFNGASKYQGVSINALLHTGPNLLPSIVGIILRFRLTAIAFTADIKKMFLQISVHPDDRDALRYLWRDQEGRLQILRFLKVIFGTNSSPFLAIGTVRHHCDRKAEVYPKAAEAVCRNMYMDDLASGSNSVEEARKIVSDASQMMKEGSFELTKWTSNREEVLNVLLDKEKSAIMQKAPEERKQKILGVMWNLGEDKLRVQSEVNPIPPERFTKRSLLKDVASVFDPLGMLSPFTIAGRILLQDCWKADAEWDDPLPREIASKYEVWRQDLAELDKISVPRHLFKSAAAVDGRIELHGFGDASEKAYGAVVYLKYQSKKGPVVQFVVSKSRVAPIKGVTLPKLELTAAVLVTQLLRFIKDEIDLAIDDGQIHAWSDSEIALHWITGDRSQDQFVRNRVAKIRDRLPSARWRYCSSKQNPADELSRGIPLKKLWEKDWISGPKWLPETEVEKLAAFRVVENQPVAANASNLVQTSEPPFELLRFPFYGALRKMAYVLRFANNARKKDTLGGSLTSEDLRRAEVFWIKHYQKEHYPEEVKALEEGKPTPKDSQIRKLDPVLDEEGLLRVGGRIDEAAESYRAKHPIIVPRSSAIARRIVERAHKIALHAWNDQVHCLLRQTCWIPKARNLVKQVRKNCPRCKMFDAKRESQTMGTLPAERLRLTRPFESCGVDFAGPINVQGDNSEMIKSYICLFVCMTTRAVHLELTSDLSTDKFLHALRRMNARRGPTKLLLSDNAKTFKSAKKILESATEQLTQKGITWKFIPERGPWQGGQYERLVRTVKTPLRKILQSSLLTFEEMQTVLCEVECQVNSRPLTAVSDEIDDFEVLTPAQFITGSQIADSDLFDASKVGAKKTNLRQRWKHVKQVTANLKSRWRKEYLVTLQERAKWLQKSRNLQKGDLVLAEDEGQPRALWPMARVQETTVGRDGLVRSAIIKKKDGKSIRRPVQRLYLLEANTD